MSRWVTLYDKIHDVGSSLTPRWSPALHSDDVRGQLRPARPELVRLEQQDRLVRHPKPLRHGHFDDTHYAADHFAHFVDHDYELTVWNNRISSFELS